MNRTSSISVPRNPAPNETVRFSRRCRTDSIYYIEGVNGVHERCENQFADPTLLIVLVISMQNKFSG